jgi:hypothetical protein
MPSPGSRPVDGLVGERQYWAHFQAHQCEEFWKPLCMCICQARSDCCELWEIVLDAPPISHPQIPARSPAPYPLPRKLLSTIIDTIKLDHCCYLLLPTYLTLNGLFCIITVHKLESLIISVNTQCSMYKARSVMSSRSLITPTLILSRIVTSPNSRPSTAPVHSQHADSMDAINSESGDATRALHTCLLSPQGVRSVQAFTPTLTRFHFTSPLIDDCRWI